jgi:membrane protein
MTTDQVPGVRAARPRQLTLRGWWQVLRRTVKEMGRDHVTLLAGGVAYAWFLALFPGMIAAVMVYGLVTDPAEVEQQVANVAEGLPSEAQTLLTDQMRSIASGSDQTLSIGLVISLALALWSASAGIASLVEAVNIAYDEEEGRNFFVKRGLSLILTLGFLVFLALSIGLIAVLPIVLDQVGLGVVATTLVEIVRWVGLILIAVLSVGLIYRIGPDRSAPKVRWLSVGAVTAVALWLAASVGMTLFVDNFGSYGETYGALAGVVVLLLWLWITALAVLLGAELNAEAELQTARDTTTGPPRPMGRRDAVKADRLPPQQR